MWRACKLGDVITLQRGHDLPEAERRDGTVPIVSSSGITGTHDTAKAAAPGVVTGRYGTLGEVYYLEEDYWPLNTALYVVDFKGNDPRFVSYFLKHVLASFQSDKAAVPGVNRNVLHALDVRCPPTRTQKRVARVLAAYDDLIDNNRRRMALLENAGQCLYEEWFMRLRFPGREHTPVVDGVPKGWERRTLGGCATFLSGGTPPKARTDFWDGEIPWVSSGELTALRIDDASLHVTKEAAEAKSRLIPANTILGVVRGMSLAKEFRIAMTTKTVCFNQDLKAIVPHPDVDPDFLFHALLAQRDGIRDRAGEAAHGTKKLDSPVLAKTPVLLPSALLRRSFSDFVTPLNAQWDNLNQQSKKLRIARDLLLPRLMSGELTP